MQLKELQKEFKDLTKTEMAHALLEDNYYIIENSLRTIRERIEALEFKEKVADMSTSIIEKTNNLESFIWEYITRIKDTINARENRKLNQ